MGVRDEQLVQPALQPGGVRVPVWVVVVMAMVVAVVVWVVMRVVMVVPMDVLMLVAMALVFPVALLAHGVPRPAHALCPGAVPKACSAWWIASITSWRA